MITYDPKNWSRILLDLPRSPVFRTLFLDVLLAGLWAALVAWAELDLLHAAVPLGPSVLSILGIILGLLLVFRTNTAYDRWWEGRRAWGQLLNVTRALAHQLDAMLDDGAGHRPRYAALLGEYPAALAAHLRRPRGVSGPHHPNRVVRELSRLVHRDVAAGALPREATIALTPLLVALDDVTGICERVRNTPIPFSYSSYVKQFVLLYALVLPFGLVREFRYGAVVASMLVFFATMGLELLAGEIEEPFGTDRNDLPTDEIAARAAADANHLLITETAAVGEASVGTASVDGGVCRDRVGWSLTPSRHTHCRRTRHRRTLSPSAMPSLSSRLLLLALLLPAGCARRAPRGLLEAPVPALRTALADPDPARRVYVAGEVARSATLAAHARAITSRRDGEVRARIVVGPDGRVEPGLLEFLPGSDATLAERLLTVLPQWRFRPAERVGRVRVRQLVLVTVQSRNRHTSVDLQPATRPEG